MNNSVNEYLTKQFAWYYDKGYITARDGNVAYRWDKDRYVVTRSGAIKHEMHPEHDFLLVDKDGKTLTTNTWTPSIETGAHLALLKTTKKCYSVHVHSPNTVALAALYTNLSRYDGDTGLAKDSSDRLIDTLNSDWPELFRYTKIGPIVRFLEPGSSDLHRHILYSMDKNDICIMQRHGVMAIGNSPNECMEHIVRLEHVSTILLKIVSASGNLESIL